MVVPTRWPLALAAGRNGSGKSAIIAALQICLGATAKITKRGGSLKELIRNDRSVTNKRAGNSRE